MKKFYTLWLFLTILLILNGCNSTKDNIVINNAKNITKITVNTRPGNGSSLKSTEDQSQITEVVNYINGLSLKKTTKDAGQYTGMAYIITIYYNNKTSTEYVHFGNMFFKELGKDWYEISYNQAEKFEGIYNEMGSK